MNKIFLWTLSKLRLLTAPFIYWWLRKQLKVEFPGKWEDAIQYLSVNQLSEKLDITNYKWDPLGGVVDYTLFDLDLFFNASENFTKPPYGRDCDDFAWIWFNWAKVHGLPTWMVLLIDGYNLKSLHFVTVIQFSEREYGLANYTMQPALYRTLGGAMEEFFRKSLTSHGRYRDLMWVVHRSYKPPSY